MLTVALQSGSNGNCIYVEAGGAKLLFDAGISGRQAATRLASQGREIDECDALILSHEHSDHVCGAGIFQRKFGLPVYATRATYAETKKRYGSIEGVRFFAAGDTLEFGPVRVHTISTPHDGVDTVCFVVEHECRRLGIFTDLGHPFTALREALSAVDAAYLESNYDPDMLWNGSYTPWAKARIAGEGGHLSNEDAADLAKAVISPRLKWLSVAHLSHENNRPELALEAQRSRVGTMLTVHHASRYGVSELLEV